MSEFVATLPLPPVGVSPNARLHWAAKHRAVRAARKCGWYWFRRFLPAGWEPKPVRLDVAYHCPVGSNGYRPRDIQNAIAALKPMIDGMVDAGVVPDDSDQWVRWGEVKITRNGDGGEPGVRVTVTELTNPMRPIPDEALVGVFGGAQ